MAYRPGCASRRERTKAARWPQPEQAKVGRRPRHGRRPPSRGSPELRQQRGTSLAPGPLIGFRLVDTVLVGVALAVDLHVAQLLLDVRARDPQARDAIDDVDGETEAVDLVANGEIERRVDVALLFVAAHVQVLVIGAPVGQSMDQPGIAVEVEDDRLVCGEQAVEVPVRETMWMLG